MPDDHHCRDTALARLLAEALQSQSKPGGAAESSACPDAEVLAAYADHGLAEEETTRWESHFADCNRCQKIIAVLAASGEELREAEVEKLASLAAASSAARQPVQKAASSWMAIWRRPALWRWLVPAAGAVSAAALWLALHQAPRGEESSQRIAATTAAPQNDIARGAPAGSSAKHGETQMAQANLPPPPTASPRPGALLRDNEAAQANPSAAAKDEPAKKQETFRSTARAPLVPEADRGLETREDAARDNRVPSAEAAEQNSKTRDALTTVSPAAPAAAPPAQPPALDGGRAVTQGLDSASRAPAPAQLKTLAQAANLAIIFASPSRRGLWRLGSGGRIEHSADQGQTWQPQPSGVTADLLAGAAPSDKIAWVVGRAATILLTEDGEHWQRVTPPPPATQPAALASPAEDWIGVEARDALHATIFSRNLRRFVTEDGGRTWTQLH